ncbi:MAG: penicillin acylase family protein [Calditrichae bacterium]|nr:penicillin acylase family protein [Calditrichia bacterium]
MKILKWSIIVVVFVVIIFSSLAYFILSASKPIYEGEIHAPKIEKTVKITYDKMGIPQIWAEKENDAFFAMGWLHASERLFQMDLTRRISQGRLSEILGDITLKMDKESRIIGHNRIAEAQLNELSEKNRTRLQAYADGINFFIEDCSALPFEFYLLGRDIKPWSVYDCLTIFSFQTWYSDALQNRDLFYVMIQSENGRKAAESLLFNYPDWAPVTVPTRGNLSWLDNYKHAVAKSFVQNGLLPFVLTTASNSWVVSPQKSASGHAMLASDPHLEITRIPQFWFYNGLHIAETNTNVLGISAAGLPFIVMGHNGQSAWAFTAGGVDITEYYEEKIDEQDSTRYLTPAGWQQFEVFDEAINISGKDDPLLFKVFKGIHGPVYFKKDSLSRTFSIDWAGFDTDLDKAVSAGFDLADVNNFSAFRKVVTQFGALDANWTYADKSGNIGYQLGTPVPVRPDGWQNLPVNGWENERIWQGYHPLDETPFSYNPERGWLATANNKQQRTGLKYEIEGNFADDRILRLNKLLKSKDIFSVSDFQSMQMDILDMSLLKWRDKIIKPLNDFGAHGIVLAEQLNAWDGYCGKESSEPALINIFIQKLKANIFKDELKEKYKYVQTSWMYALLDNPMSPWFDDINTQDKIESCDEIIKNSLKDALVTVGTKKWSDILSIKMEHPFAAIPGFAAVLGLRKGPWMRGGSIGTLNASFLQYNPEKENFNVIVAPSWRFIIDFADTDAIQMVLPTGNSGNPMSPHFDDFLEMWKNGSYWSIPLTREQVFKNSITAVELKSE